MAIEEPRFPGVETGDHIKPITSVRVLGENGTEDEELARPFSVNEVLGSRGKRIRVVRTAREACATILPGEDVVWDLETGGLNPWRAPIAVISLFGRESQVPCILHVRGEIPPEIRQLMQSPRSWVSHNGTNFDRPFLHQSGINTYREGMEHYDTLVGESVTKTSGRHDVRVNLQATLARRVGKKVTKDADHGSWMNSELDAQQVAYCVDDVQFGHRLRDAQVQKCTEEGRLGALEFEQRLCQVVTSMVLTGLPIDLDALGLWHEESEKLTSEAGTRIFAVVGSSFNPGSPVQVKKAILEEFGLELQSTRADILEDLAQYDTPIGRFCKDILTWRSGTKRTGMYDPDWMNQHVQYDGRIHGKFWQIGAETGRFTATDPNMQQWPRDGRRVIGGEEGMVIVAGDYEAIEVMVAAGLANDANLLEDCLGDPHANLAKFFTGGRELTAEAFAEIRRIAKAGNFTLLFGGGVKRFHEACLASGAKITLPEARQFVDQYLRRYAGITRMRQQAFRMADSGVVKLVFPAGLRRVMVGPEVTPTRILNNVVQGTAAAGMKYAMVELYDRGLVHGYLGSTVHDELVACVPVDEADTYSHELRECMLVGMARAISGIPTRVSLKVGSHWK
jgi:DNA polymerase I-like protein with 3'-5' exonuclease and polymerase domains